MTDKLDEADDLASAASDARDLATELRLIRTNSVPKWMGYALLGVLGLLLAAVIGASILAIPIVRTARTVQDVAGPDAQKAQAAQTQGFLLFFLCTQRENTSEARVLNGDSPLPLRQGCPPYNFDPNRPVTLPTPTTTATRPRAKRTTTTTSAATTSTQASEPPSTTERTTTTTCPTVKVGQTCLTLP